MKKKFLIFTLVLALLFSSLIGCTPVSEPPTSTNPEPESFSKTEYDLVNNGCSDYKIVIAEEATDVEKLAAEELQLFIKESTEVALPVVVESGLGVQNKVISIGKTSLRAQNADIEKDVLDLEYGGALIKTVGDNLFITGSTNRGTLNATYKFLEYQIGFRAYTVDFVDLSYYTTLKLLDFDYKYNPSVDQMVTNSYEINGEERVTETARMFIVAANGLGGMDHDGYYYDLWCHTTELILPIQTYGGQHPDWYGNGQLCFSNDEMMEQFAYVLFSGYVSTTTRPYIMIGAADKKSCCTCDRCRAESVLYGGQSGIFTRFMNKLSDRIEEYLVEYKIEKEVMLIGLNYYYYESAPVIKNADGTFSPIHESVIPDNEGSVTVGVCYAPIQACYTHAFGDKNCVTNSGGYKDLLGWSSLTDNMFMYTYGSNFSSGLSKSLHYNNWSYMAEQYKLFEQIGLDYIFDESCRPSASPMSDMRVYVRSRLAWNPHVDFESLIDEFMDKFYGVGAKYVKEYYYAVMDHFETIYTIAETECQGCFYTIRKEEYWPLNTLQNFESILVSGINAIMVDNRLTDEEKQVYAERIRKEWYLLKVNEYGLYSKYFSEQQILELQEIAKIAKEKYGISA